MNPYAKVASYDVGVNPAVGVSVTVLADGSLVVAWNDYRTGWVGGFANGYE